MHQLARFLGVGLLATALHVLIALLTKAIFDLSPQMANLSGFCGAVLFSYLGHSRFTFGVIPDHSVHFPRFLTVSAAGLAISSLITQLVTVHLGAPFAVAMACVAIAVPPATYLAAKFWAFAQTSDDVHRLWTGICIAMISGIGFMALLSGRSINHDTAWYLVATRKWLSGARLYTDIVEVNPPLNFYLTAPAIWLADLTGLTETNSQYLALSILLSVSLIWAWVVLGRSIDLTPGKASIVLVGAAAALVLPALENVGQREHLLMLFIFPWFVAYLVQDHPDTGQGAVARALFASIGICLKPHFLLFPVMLTLHLIVRQRSLRPILSTTNITMIVAGSAYVAAVFLLHPDYLTTIVPLAVQVYGDYGFGLAQTILNIGPEVLLLFFLLAALLARSKVACPNFGALTAAVLAAVGSFALQDTGFPYQAIPIHSFVFFAAVWTLANVPFTFASGSVAVLCLTVLSVQSVTRGFYHAGSVLLFKDLVEAAGTAPRLTVLSTNLWPSFPLALETHAEWSSRYPALWLIPGAVNKLAKADCTLTPDTCTRLTDILTMTRNDIVTDLATNRPEILIVHKDPMYFDDRPFDLIRFLQGDPRFADILAEYSPLMDIRGFDVRQHRPSGTATPLDVTR